MKSFFLIFTQTTIDANNLYNVVRHIDSLRLVRTDMYNMDLARDYTGLEVYSKHMNKSLNFGKNGVKIAGLKLSLK